MEMISNLGVFDYERKKLCDLYESQVSLPGQAYEIRHAQNQDGVNQISFNLPYMVEKDKNFRWDYLKNEYLIRLHHNGNDEWFVANKPTKKKSKDGIIGSVTCNSIAILLKTKNIYKEFDDENGIGTIDYLMEQILAGTGWHLGYCEVLYEADGTTEKIRSLQASGSTGALGLINSVCNLFQCRPVYHTDTLTVDIYSTKNRDMIFEAEVGRNLDALSVTTSSDDIITRLYVEGEYGDDGYVGIDDVNPTGLTYLMNFEYYREIGVFTETHEAALETYMTDIQEVVADIKTIQRQITVLEGEANDLVGQCKLTVYYTAQGFTAPVYLYGDPTAAQQNLGIGDEVVILKNDGTHRYATITTTIQDLLQAGEYAVAKFATKAAGTIGAKEVQVEAKEKEIDNLTRKINATTKADKIAEYRAEIAALQDEIDAIYEDDDGLYDQMSDLIKPEGILDQIKGYMASMSILTGQQDEIEATFIAAMGNLLRDGKWQNNNYIVGQEAALLADAQDRMDIMSRPSASYTFDYIRMTEEYGVPMEDIKMNAIVRTNDDELDIHENLFITKIVTGIDEKNYGTIDVSNQDITMSSSDLSALLSRMSQLSDLIEQKNQIYNRAEAISKSGTFYADRLNGMIDVVKNQIMSSVSNWYTDDNGNMIFESLDGGSAMMLSGAGFMLASDRLEDGSWNWRLTGTGKGLNADEITAGFLSAERIEAGSISTKKVTPTFGNTLIISGNESITNLNNSMAPAFVVGQAYNKGDMVNVSGVLYVFTADYAGGTFDDAPVSNTSVSTTIELLPDEIIQKVESKGYNKTYIQMTDPTLDPDKRVGIGDYWIQAEPDHYTDYQTWAEVLVGKFDAEKTYRSGDAVRFNNHVYIFTQEHTGAWDSAHVREKTDSDTLPINNDDASVHTWGTVRAVTWGFLSGYSKLMCWNGSEWLTVYDMSNEATAFTRIDQTKEAIVLEAQRANAVEGQLAAQIVLTADEIRQEVGREYTSKAFFQMTADGKINLTSTNFNSLGSTSSGIYITPTSLDINTSGTFTVKSGGAMTINSGGNLTISSGGNFSLTSTNFTVTTSGQITAKSGKIGDWNITTGQLYASSGSTKVVLDSSTTYYPLPGGSTNTNMYALWCGADAPNNAPFSVTKDGIVTIKKLRVNTSSGTYQDVDFSNFITTEDETDYDFSAAMGKLKFQTVKSISKDNTGKVTIVTTTGTGGGSKTISFDG